MTRVEACVPGLSQAPSGKSVTPVWRHVPLGSARPRLGSQRPLCVPGQVTSLVGPPLLPVEWDDPRAPAGPCRGLLERIKSLSWGAWSTTGTTVTVVSTMRQHRLGPTGAGPLVPAWRSGLTTERSSVKRQTREWIGACPVWSTVPAPWPWLAAASPGLLSMGMLPGAGQA